MWVKTCLLPNQMYGLEGKYGFQDKLFIWKPKLIILGAYFFYVGPKRRFRQKSSFSSLSSTHIWNARLLREGGFLDFFFTSLEIQEYCMYHVTICHKLTWQKRCALFRRWWWHLPMISNTDIPNRKIHIYFFWVISFPKTSRLLLWDHTTLLP